MLARKHKLDPATLFARPHRTLRGEYMALKYARPVARGTANGTFAAVISAKVAPGAVLRHRVKRVLYDEARARLPLAHDIAVTIRAVPKGDKRAAMTTLRSELTELLGRIDLSTAA